MNVSKDPYAGKILYVNLTTGKKFIEPTEKYSKKFLGGRGINQWLLYENVKPGIDPLDPDDIIIFGAGVLCGTLAPTAARLSVVSKNCWTNGLGHGNVGGKFGPELKFAGYDHLIIQGRAEKPVYLWINDDNVEIVDAKDVWGKSTWEADDYLKEKHGIDIHVGAIGQAGENLVKSAGIIFNRARALARCGVGAVMGSKNLKAVAVHGTGSINVADPEKFTDCVDKLWNQIDGLDFTKFMRTLGTNCYGPAMNQNGSVPVRNFQDMYFPPERWEKLLSGYGHQDKFEVGKVACASCPIHCSHFYEINEGKYVGLKCEGFEVNIPYDFGTKFDVDYAPWLLQAQALCSQYGLDIDSTSSSISWAFECFEKELLIEDDTDGLRLEWGNYEAVGELIRKIAFKEGFGALLSEGCKAASDRLGKGSEKYAMHIKGQPLFEMLRVPKAWSLGSVVASRGGGHLDGAPCCEFLIPQLPRDICEKVYGVPTAGDPMTYEGKGKLVSYHEKLKGAIDCLGICYFATVWGSPDMPKIDDYTSLLNYALGEDFRTVEILEVGERLNNLGKAFNALHTAFRRKDDYPVERFFKEPIPSGPRKGAVLERAKWDEMLNEYYEANGWNKETSLPEEKTLRRLDLKEVAEELKNHGLI